MANQLQQYAEDAVRRHLLDRLRAFTAPCDWLEAEASTIAMSNRELDALCKLTEGGVHWWSARNLIDATVRILGITKLAPMVERVARAR